MRFAFFLLGVCGFWRWVCLPHRRTRGFFGGVYIWNVLGAMCCFCFTRSAVRDAGIGWGDKSFFVEWELKLHLGCCSWGEVEVCR